MRWKVVRGEIRTVVLARWLPRPDGEMFDLRVGSALVGTVQRDGASWVAYHGIHRVGVAGNRHDAMAAVIRAITPDPSTLR